MVEIAITCLPAMYRVVSSYSNLYFLLKISVRRKWIVNRFYFSLFTTDKLYFSDAIYSWSKSRHLYCPEKSKTFILGLNMSQFYYYLNCYQTLSIGRSVGSKVNIKNLFCTAETSIRISSISTFFKGIA